MAGFFSVRLAPGLRISASSRGLRAHVGPRGARLHFGGGRPGVSTGAGPFTFYEPLTGGSGRRAGAARPVGRTPSPATLAKRQHADDLQRQLQVLTALHREQFPAAQPQLAPRPAVATLAQVEAQTRQEYQKGISWLQFSARGDARRRAKTDAPARLQGLVAAAEKQQADQQHALDEQWAALQANDPKTVMAVVSSRFADNEAPAAAVGVEGDEVQLATLVPGEDVVPDEVPGTTSAGNVSVRTMSRTDHASLYREVVAGYAVATVKEAFAGAPGLKGAALVAVRDEGKDIYGSDRVRPVLAVRFTREALDGIQWAQVSAWDVVQQAGTDLHVQLAGRTHEVTPIALDDEPDLAALVEAIDWDDSAGHDDET